MNAVVFAVLLMVGLSLVRVNIVIALIISALAGGLVGGMTLIDTVNAFTSGLGGGATIALNYAMLGAFAVTISRSGITDVLARTIVDRVQDQQASDNQLVWLKAGLMSMLLLAAIMSQNLVPVHIAFIPILVPPLLSVINQMQIDRRALACLLTFGLTATYMLLPVGFGQIFLNNILLKNLNESGLAITAAELPAVMAIPVFGMFLGLLFALFVTYRGKRNYHQRAVDSHAPVAKEIKAKHLYVAGAAIVTALVAQLHTDSVIVGSLAGLTVFVLGGVLKIDETQDVFARGVQMMGLFGFIMISAAGFAEVMKATQAIDTLVHSTTSVVGDNKILAALLMLCTGLLVTMGIGSSFSTIPIIAAIYVPLCVAFGFSPVATAAIVGTAAALGDAGSPASDSTLGPTSGLNADGQHDHIWDTVVPTFIHYNIPLIIFGVIAAMTL